MTREGILKRDPHSHLSQSLLMFLRPLCLTDQWRRVPLTQEYEGHRCSGGTGMGQVWGRPRTKEDIAEREAHEAGRVKGRFWELLEQGWYLESTGVAEQSLGVGVGTVPKGRTTQHSSQHKARLRPPTLLDSTLHPPPGSSWPAQFPLLCVFY